MACYPWVLVWSGLGYLLDVIFLLRQHKWTKNEIKVCHYFHVMFEARKQFGGTFSI